MDRNRFDDTVCAPRPADKANDREGSDPDQWDGDRTPSENELFDELLKKYSSAICTSEQLEKIDLPSRNKLVGSWLYEGDLGFVYGERGSGKTWFVDALATHLSTGNELHGWNVPEKADVLLVD